MNLKLLSLNYNYSRVRGSFSHSLWLTMAISILVILVASMFAVASTAQAYSVANTSENILDGVNATADKEEQCDPTGDNPECNPEDELKGVIRSAINVFSVVVGVVSVIMIMYGGFRYVTSQGNEGGVKTARNTIIYAIIGVVVVILAQIIVSFVIGEVGDI